MTDEGIICEWMEPRPTDNRQRIGTWWPFASGLVSSGIFPRRPCDLTLDRLHEVEKRLSDEQWEWYKALIESCGPREWMWWKRMLHATAPQKIKALATVLRTAPVADKEPR